MQVVTDLMMALARRPLLCDGAMGTQLMARGLPPGVCGETWNLDRPDAVQAIHAAYRQAGCDLITSNSFGGTRCNLEKHGLAAKTEAINRAAAQLARQALTKPPATSAAADRAASGRSGIWVAPGGGGGGTSKAASGQSGVWAATGGTGSGAVASGGGSPGWVLGDVGPFGDFLEPMGDMTEPRLTEIFAHQIESLYRGGADAIIIETMTDPAEASVAVRAAKMVKPAPVMATFAFNRGPDGTFRTMMGATPKQALAAVIAAGADVVGANCGTSLGLPDYLDLAAELVEAAGKTPVIIQPNAGSPVMVEGKMVHPATPADMAAIVRPLLERGVRIIGGCCGTSPAHLKAMGQAMSAR